MVNMYDIVLLDHFPLLYKMADIDTIEYTRNLRKIARLSMYPRSEAQDLTMNEVTVWLIEHPEVYHFLKL